MLKEEERRKNEEDGITGRGFEGKRFGDRSQEGEQNAEGRRKKKEERMKKMESPAVDSRGKDSGTGARRVSRMLKEEERRKNEEDGI